MRSYWLGPNLKSKDFHRERKKRAIKSMVFRFQRGTLEAERQKYLKGYLAFIISVEPSFFEALRIKFGSNVLQQILQNS